MNQEQKTKIISDASVMAIEEVAKLLNTEATLQSVAPAMRSAMGEHISKIYDLSLFYGQEADRSFETGAFFASCLLSAAANEGMLTLTCLQDEKSVKSTAPYRGAQKASKSYIENVADFGLDKLIKISTELGWIPQDVVNEELLHAVVQDFPVMAKTVYPKWSATQIEEKLSSLQRCPGPEMLKVMQDMRNLVHAPRWLKTGSTLEDSEFALNCKLAVLVSREIMQCLVIRSTSSLDMAIELLRTIQHSK